LVDGIGKRPVLGRQIERARGHSTQM
jgi:hypothetical protein